jgi:hypothetical protein
VKKQKNFITGKRKANGALGDPPGKKFRPGPFSGDKRYYPGGSLRRRNGLVPKWKSGE